MNIFLLIDFEYFIINQKLFPNFFFKVLQLPLFSNTLLIISNNVILACHLWNSKRKNSSLQLFLWLQDHLFVQIWIEQVKDSCKVLIHEFSLVGNWLQIFLLAQHSNQISNTLKNRENYCLSMTMKRAIVDEDTTFKRAWHTFTKHIRTSLSFAFGFGSGRLP